MIVQCMFYLKLIICHYLYNNLNLKNRLLHVMIMYSCIITSLGLSSHLYLCQSEYISFDNVIDVLSFIFVHWYQIYKNALTASSILFMHTSTFILYMWMFRMPLLFLYAWMKFNEISFLTASFPCRWLHLYDMFSSS